VRTGVADVLGAGFLAIDPSATVDGRAIPPSIVGARASIAHHAHVGSLAVLAEDVRVGEGSSVERSVVLAGASIGAGCMLRDCIVGPGAVIGDRTQVLGGAIVGEGVRIGADNVLAHGARLFPGMEGTRWRPRLLRRRNCGWTPRRSPPSTTPTCTPTSSACPSTCAMRSGRSSPRSCSRGSRRAG